MPEILKKPSISLNSYLEFAVRSYAGNNFTIAQWEAARASEVAKYYAFLASTGTPVHGNEYNNLSFICEDLKKPSA